MAAQGQTLAQIELAGEWSSTGAPFSYMNTDIADRAQGLRRMVHAELHYDTMEEPEEYVESDSETDLRQQLLASLRGDHQQPAIGSTKMETVEEVRPPPGLEMPGHWVRPANQAEDIRECISHVPVVLIKAMIDLGVGALAPRE